MALDGDGRIIVPATFHAQEVGLLLAKSGTPDIADAHVVICAQRAGQAVITSDPFDMKRLDPGIQVFAV
ncbi:MAG: hypothetical protein FJW39_14015 [Acidobacteria bacterium]|nr:hypothetical protein [Acidobacteriota bacterium]